MATATQTKGNLSGAARYVPAGVKSPASSAWAYALLTYVGAPLTSTNVTNLLTWLHNEQSASSWAADATNPLGVEQGGSVHPQTDALTGIQLTGDTILSGYPALLSALRNSAPAAVTFAAIIPWSGSGPHTTYAQRGVKGMVAYGPLWVSGSGAQTEGAIPKENYPGENILYKAGNAVVTPIIDTAKATVSVGEFLGKISNPTTLKSVGVFLLGGVLIVGGFVIFVSTTKTAQRVESGGVHVAAV